MARLKIPDCSNNPPQNTENNDGKEDAQATPPRYTAQMQREACSKYNDPYVLSQEQYMDLFGDSEDENECESFHGFEEESVNTRDIRKGMPKEDTVPRKQFLRNLSPTDESNPYKKKYLNYRRDRSGKRGIRKISFSDTTGVPSRNAEVRGRDTGREQHGSKYQADKENKLTLANERRGDSNASKAARNIISKAHKVKYSSPIKGATKSNEVSSSRRRKRSNDSSGITHSPPEKKLKIGDDQQYKCDYESPGKAGDISKLKSTVDGSENINVHSCTNLEVRIKDDVEELLRSAKKKKVRIKNATLSQLLPESKKKAKMKNLSTCTSTNTSPYKRATFPDFSNVQVKLEPEDYDSYQSGSFTNMFSNPAAESQNGACSSDLNTGLILEDVDGNRTDLKVERSPVKQRDEITSKSKKQKLNVYTTRSYAKKATVLTDAVIKAEDCSSLSESLLSNIGSSGPGGYRNIGKCELRGLLSEREKGWPFWDSLSRSKPQNCSDSQSIRKHNNRDDGEKSVRRKLKTTVAENATAGGGRVGRDAKKDGVGGKRKRLVLKKQSKDKRRRGIRDIKSKGRPDKRRKGRPRRTHSEESSSNERTAEAGKPEKVDSCNIKSSESTSSELSPPAKQSTKKSRPTYKIKLIKRNGVIHMINTDHCLITFCGTCKNCLKEKDCGECEHCRNHKNYTTRILPCWRRRCLQPIVGKHIDIEESLTDKKSRKEAKRIDVEESHKDKKSKKEGNANKRESTDETMDTESVDAEKGNCKEKQENTAEEPVDGDSEEKKGTEPEEEKSLIRNENVDESKEKEEEEGEDLEKVEVCLVSDSPLAISSKEGDDCKVEFHVQKLTKKLKRKDLIANTDIDVFTGMSLNKSKLRSTMNELISRSEDQILPRVEFGAETLVKLPWPNDSNQDAAWVSGHHVCTTMPTEYNLWNLCFLCGSAGKEKMLICNFCCETFHPFCLDVDPIDTKNWCCDRCKRCIVCGFKENLLMCDTCHDCYHADCLGPFYQRDTEGDEETWVCGKCVKCTKCGQRRAGKSKTSKWMHNFSMCEECGINWQRGNFCPICEKLYGEHDDSLKMMCCFECERWIHRECEDITVDDYEILTDLPESIQYICKLCREQDKSEMEWYQEIQGGLIGGFQKIYCDVTSHKDFKSVKEQLGELKAIRRSLKTFDVIFRSMNDSKFVCVNDFYVIMLQAFQHLALTIKEVAVADVPMSFYPNTNRLLTYFSKGLTNIFPWFSPDDIGEGEKKPPVPLPLEPCSIISNGNEASLVHDHQYAAKYEANKSVTTRDEDGEWAFNILFEDDDQLTCNAKKHPDLRRCIFCNQFGDGELCGAGRLLYAGMNEWVHINCALWSAEVYEDESGRLRHVHDALKRGNKMKCVLCKQLGASIGCCSFKCPKTYHFICAKKDGAVFLDDKKIYCEGHLFKANKNLILQASDLSVPRRVIVDLTRFKSFKRVQRGLDPKSISVHCGGFELQTLGALSKYSDFKRTLVPCGYRVTRIFWSSTNPTRRCKYSCEIHLLRAEAKPELEPEVDCPEVVVEPLTYCHDRYEWGRILNRTVCNCPRKVKGTKRKITFDMPCRKCIYSQKYSFMSHDDYQKSICKVTERKNKLDTGEDHNFFPLKVSEPHQSSGCVVDNNVTSSECPASTVKSCFQKPQDECAMDTETSLGSLEDNNVTSRGYSAPMVESCFQKQRDESSMDTETSLGSLKDSDVTLSGCSARTVESCFQKQSNVSPMDTETSRDSLEDNNIVSSGCSARTVASCFRKKNNGSAMNTETTHCKSIQTGFDNPSSSTTSVDLNSACKTLIKADEPIHPIVPTENVAAIPNSTSCSPVQVTLVDSLNHPMTQSMGVIDSCASVTDSCTVSSSSPKLISCSGASPLFHSTSASNYTFEYTADSVISFCHTAAKTSLAATIAPSMENKFNALNTLPGASQNRLGNIVDLTKNDDSEDSVASKSLMSLEDMKNIFDSDDDIPNICDSPVFDIFNHVSINGKTSAAENSIDPVVGIKNAISSQRPNLHFSEITGNVTVNHCSDKYSSSDQGPLSSKQQVIRTNVIVSNSRCNDNLKAGNSFVYSTDFNDRATLGVHGDIEGTIIGVSSSPLLSETCITNRLSCHTSSAGKNNVPTIVTNKVGNHQPGNMHQGNLKNLLAISEVLPSTIKSNEPPISHLLPNPSQLSTTDLDPSNYTNVHLHRSMETSPLLNNVVNGFASKETNHEAGMKSNQTVFIGLANELSISNFGNSSNVLASFSGRTQHSSMDFSAGSDTLSPFSPKSNSLITDHSTPSNLPKTNNSSLLKDLNTSKQVNSYLQKLSALQDKFRNSTPRVSTPKSSCREEYSLAVGQQVSGGSQSKSVCKSSCKEEYPLTVEDQVSGGSQSKSVIVRGFSKRDGEVSEAKKSVTFQQSPTIPQKVPVVTHSKLSFSPCRELKRDLLFRQLKEYLSKHPNVINLVGNSKKRESGNVPIVNLTESTSHSESLCYSVYLPEHLWNDLIEAGIAKNDIQKILRENTWQNRKHIMSNMSPPKNGYVRNYSPAKKNRLQYDHCTPPPLAKIQNTIIKFSSDKSPFSVKNLMRHSEGSIYSQFPHVSYGNSNQRMEKPQRSEIYTCTCASQTTSDIYMPSQLNSKLSSSYDDRSTPQNFWFSKNRGRSVTSSNKVMPIAHSVPYLSVHCRCNSVPTNTFYNTSVKNRNYVDFPSNQSGYLNPSIIQSTPNAKMMKNDKLTNNISLKNYNKLSLDLNIPSVLENQHLSHRDMACGSYLSDKTYLHASCKQSSAESEPLEKQGCYKPETSITCGLNLTPLKPKKKYKKRIKVANGELDDTDEPSVDYSPVRGNVSHDGNLDGIVGTMKSSSKSAGPVMRKKKTVKPTANIISTNTEIDFCNFDANVCGDQFTDTSLLLETPEKVPKKKKTRKQKKNYQEYLKNFLEKQDLLAKKNRETRLNFCIKNEDGWECSSSSLLELWQTLISEINDRRMEIKLSPFQVDLNDAYEFLGLTKEFIAYLVEQLPGGHKCRKYKFQHHLPCLREDDNDLPINPTGFARGENAIRHAENDMFAWLASPYRIPPKFGDEPLEEEVLGGTQDLPVAMKYRFLKSTSKDHVGVFRSKIQGRGLYCKKTIEGGDMIIEYSGELIRASLTDRRQEYYEKKGIGCYMFRIDDMDVVDATMKGNAARFINHSCDPNCYSKIITVDGCKKIVIFALRRIMVGEELTYDYKFSPEEDKLPCYCGTKKCRKYMN